MRKTEPEAEEYMCRVGSVSSDPNVCGDIFFCFAKKKEKEQTAESAFVAWAGEIRRQSTKEERAEVLSR